MSVTVEDVLGVFGGGMIVNLELQCEHCGPKARIVDAVWANRRERWQCHFCGRERTKVDKAGEWSPMVDVLSRRDGDSDWELPD